MPNPDSTQSLQVGKIMTYNWPKWSFKSAKLGNIGFEWLLVDFGFATRIEILPDFGRNLVESHQMWLDLSRFGWYSSNLAKIWLDLLRSPYIEGVWVLAYLIFGWNSRSLTEREQVIEWVRFVGFLDGQTATQTDSIGSWHRQPMSNWTTTWIGQVLGQRASSSGGWWTSLVWIMHAIWLPSSDGFISLMGA